MQAQPAAHRDGITGLHDGRLKVSCTQAPEQGKANKALTRILAGALQLKRSQIRLHSGETASRKVYLITGIDAADLKQRVAEVLAVDRD